MRKTPIMIAMPMVATTAITFVPTINSLHIVPGVNAPTMAKATNDK